MSSTASQSDHTTQSVMQHPHPHANNDNENENDDADPFVAVEHDQDDKEDHGGPQAIVQRSVEGNEEIGEDEYATRIQDTGTNRSELFEDAATTAAITRPPPLSSGNGTTWTTAATVSSSSKWELTPLSLLLRTMEYMDNDTLMLMCLVCKQIRDIIWTGQGMETKLVRIFELSPLKKNSFDEDGSSRVRRFVSNMNQHFQNATKTRILKGFQHWKVQDVTDFSDIDYAHGISNEELGRLTQNVRMTEIVSLDVSLDVSLPLPAANKNYRRLLRVISFMVPNLQQLDLSHSRMSSEILGLFAVRCPRLEIIRWNNNRDYAIEADGSDLQPMNNLKELYCDNWTFLFRTNHDHLVDEYGDTDDDDDDDDDDDNGVSEMKAMSDSNNYPNVFFFCTLCNNPLERISLRSAQYDHIRDLTFVPEIIPQSILMKFVRKAPATLVWFRSDLSPANIRILQSERPGIQFLN